MTTQQIENIEQLITEKLKTFSNKRLQQVLDFVGLLEYRQQYSKSSQRKDKSKLSLVLIQKYAGCLDGEPSDLPTNKKYLEELGKQYTNTV